MLNSWLGVCVARFADALEVNILVVGARKLEETGFIAELAERQQNQIEALG